MLIPLIMSILFNIDWNNLTTPQESIDYPLTCRHYYVWRFSIRLSQNQNR
jgi:hypothetical protein